HRYRAVRDILCKSEPRIRGRSPGQPLVAEGRDLVEATTDAVAALDQSFLFVQGPPGSGKTYTGARVVVEMIRLGKKVGVCSNSHAAIHNVLDKVEELAEKHEVPFEGIKKSSGGEATYQGRFIRTVTDKKDVSLDVPLLAGTAWLFADPRFDQH